MMGIRTLLGTVLLHAVLCSDLLDCDKITSDIHQEYCNTLQLIGLYQRKLNVLRSLITLQGGVSQPPFLIVPPSPKTPHVYVHNTIYKGETLLLPPNKIVHSNNVYNIDGSLVLRVNSTIINVAQNQITCRQGDQTTIINTKHKISNLTLSISSQDIHSLWYHNPTSKIGRTLVQWSGKEITISSGKGHFRNLTTQHQIIGAWKGHAGALLFLSKSNYETGTITSNTLTQHQLPYEVFNGTFDGNMFLFLLTTDGNVSVFDTRLNKEVSQVKLFDSNLTKVSLLWARHKLFVHRQTEAYVRVYNITSRRQIIPMENITVCSNKNISSIFRYQLYSIGNIVYIMCGQGAGDSSEWKLAEYTIAEHDSYLQSTSRWSQFGVIILVLALVLGLKKYAQKNTVSPTVDSPSIEQQNQECNESKDYVAQKMLQTSKRYQKHRENTLKAKKTN